MELLIKFSFTVLVVFVISLVLAFPVMWLWNWLMPTIFGLIKITVWQPLGLMVLSSLLIKAGTSSSD